MWHFRKSLTDISSYFYFIDEDLIYYFDLIDTQQWLCVFKTLEKKVFKMIHDDHYHADFHQIYNNIVADLYIQNLSWCLKQYITHCFKCLHYQTVRHVSYEALQLIIEFSILFHTVTVDFILELSKISSDLNAMITIICKFFKKMKFISDKEIWTAAEWAKVYFAHITDWSISIIWIEDRNSKWLSEFWIQLFSNMKIRIMIITVYHSQSDDQSECTNQITEIILWYALEEASNDDFTDFLSAFKWVFNNSINIFTDWIFNEIIYEFNLTNFFNVINDSDAKEFKTEHKIHQQKT